MGWTFHRVCMKEASTWMLPLEMDKCCRKEGKRICSVHWLACSTLVTFRGRQTIRGQRWKQLDCTFPFTRINDADKVMMSSHSIFSHHSKDNLIINQTDRPTLDFSTWVCRCGWCSLRRSLASFKLSVITQWWRTQNSDWWTPWQSGTLRLLKCCDALCVCVCV